MLRVVTFNANGIRSASQKGFWTWFDSVDADILCVQELKAQLPDLSNELKEKAGYSAAFHCAQKRGYSGCGLWAKKKPQNVQIGFGNSEFDAEGRYVRFDYEKLSVISCYFPSGTSGEDRQEAKYRFLAAMLKHLEALKKNNREVLLCGDVNIAHKEIDIKNWKANLTHTGFLPEERQWVTDLIDTYHWVDVFRRLDERPNRYTWWSQRGNARAKNVGWRIDYQFATEGLAQKASTTSIYNEEKFSDHAPLLIDYDGRWLE